MAGKLKVGDMAPDFTLRAHVGRGSAWLENRCPIIGDQASLDVGEWVWVRVQQWRPHDTVGTRIPKMGGPFGGAFQRW